MVFFKDFAKSISYHPFDFWNLGTAICKEHLLVAAFQTCWINENIYGFKKLLVFIITFEITLWTLMLSIQQNE